MPKGQSKGGSALLCSMHSLLNEAYQHGYAIPAFNTYNYASIRSVFEAADELQTPVIIAFGENVSHVMDLESVVEIVRALSTRYPVPVALHLDHAKSFELILRAIRAGFTSVMYDGSADPYEENVAQTRKIVEIAHAVGVSVEAELGAVAAGRDTDEEDSVEQLTDPLLARSFVESTAVDALAVSIGTVHGLYSGEPKIDLERLKDIRSNVSVPLVLHGGSGTPRAILLQAIQFGVAKVNVNTEVSKAGVAAIQKLLAAQPGAHMSHLTVAVKDGMKVVVKRYLEMLTAESLL